MTSLGSHHPFTPQRSPSMPSSQASSQSPPQSEGEGGGGGGGGGDLARRQVDVDVSQADPSQRPFVTMNTAGTVFNCWTAHQSHGQVTILFYVPRWTKKEDLQVVLGDDYVIAGIQSGQEMVVQARLAGRINRATSSWQLEKPSQRQSHRRSRSRSQSHTRAIDRSSAGSQRSSSGKGSSDGSSQQRQGQVHANDAQSEVAYTASGSGTGRVQRTVSPTTSSEASSFDLMARSTDTLESRASRWSHTGPEMPSPSTPASPLQRLDQSLTLSEESGYLPSGSTSGAEGIRSLESSMLVDGGSSVGASDSVDLLADAKLVTLHLDKVDTGIWPYLVSGPAPLSLLSSARAGIVLRFGQNSWDTALSEALVHRPGIEYPETEAEARISPSAAADEEDEMHDESFTQSTTTVDTITSDDSTTVLGSRPASSDESNYDMDPTSLALMGIRHAQQGHRSPFGSANTYEETQAFEYFKRAWRRGEVPLATKRLVEDFLPRTTQQSNAMLKPFRSRLTASLGGPTALARLYVSYARLQLPSYQDKQLPLAFPLGGLSNPFGGAGSSHLSSPRSQGEGFADAVIYLREACLLDKNVAISIEEWQEAESLELTSGDAADSWPWQEHTEGSAAIASENERASQSRRSTSKRNKRSTRKRKSMSSKYREDGDPGLVFLLVSRAALLSVMVAGGVAVAGWWRKGTAGGHS